MGRHKDGAPVGKVREGAVYVDGRLVGKTVPLSTEDRVHVIERTDELGTYGELSHPGRPVEPWGHLIRISITVEGDRVNEEGKAIIEASQAACDVLERYGVPIDMAGASLLPVQERPIDQGAA